ncbi:hypothetical protein ACHAXA_011404 [Cyclostephanos tholiformis]|uniref:Reverse transcriptase domain-containing protein n=1 Tax=Cyclostephanos tholiformis TaxID=382380 RepID=A0ABD3REK3_9STRA
MKFTFEVKTEPVCVAAVAITCYVAVAVIQVCGGGIDPAVSWFPTALATLNLIITIKFLINRAGRLAPTPFQLPVTVNAPHRHHQRLNCPRVPAVAMARELPPTTFAALFNDASRDPFLINGGYDAFLAPFRVEENNNAAPLVVRQLLAAAANQLLPVALVALVDGRLTPLFLPFRRDRAMGVEEHPATDGRMYAFEGELIGTQGYLVELADDAFNLTPRMTIPDVGHVRGLLATDPQLQAVGPFAENSPHTSTVRTRFVVPLPNKYAALFLAHERGITPRYYFDTILPMIEADGMAGACEPLTRFCLAAITTLAGAGSPVTINSPRPPGRHVPLLEQASQLLAAHLTGLRRTTAPEVNLQPLINTIMAGQELRVQEQANARLDRELKENTTVAAWLGAENFARLLKYCGVADEADLPPLWSAWAKAPAKDRLTIFEGKVANEFFSLGAIYEQFTPSLFMLTQITSLKWGMLNPDALETGSLGNAYLFTDTDVELAQGVNRQIDFIQQGGATPSYADAQTLLKAKINLPGPDASVRCVLRMLAVYRALLPEGHRLISFLQQHHSLMNAYDPGWATYPTYIPHLRGLKGVYHLQWLSLKLTRYFGQLDRNMANVQVPDPHEIIDHIQEQRQWEPNLTETFASRYNLRALLGVHTRALPSIGSLPSLGATSTTTGSTISGVTFPSQPTSTSNDAGPTATGASSRVTNEGFNEALFGSYKTSAVKAKTVRDRVKAGTIPPLPTSTRDSTKPMPAPSPVRETFSTLVTPDDKPGAKTSCCHRRAEATRDPPRTSDFSALDNVPHPARRLLRHYKHCGAPVKFSTPPWTRHQLQRTLSRGPHKSAHEYQDYLAEEFVDMINKGQWVVLPFSSVRHLPGLRISPPGVIPQRDRRPRWIVDYSWWDVNANTLPLAAMESMQFGHALDRILREILLANPAFGPVYLIKLDISDGFYRIALAVNDIPKLGVAFPTPTGDDPLVAFPLVLPMGWKNSPPIFSTATETIADLTNARLRTIALPPPHLIDDLAEHITSQPPFPPLPSVNRSTAPRDPSLPAPATPLAYADVYVDDFVGAAQRSPLGTRGLDNRRRVRRLLLHAVDDVFRPLSPGDDPARQEPVSMKKLAAGDCSWGTIKQVLGWIINSVDMTISLPPHRAARLLEVLDSFPPTQKRTSPNRWQAALGVHDALNDFRWMHDNISTRPTRIAELIPLPPVAAGHHDASGKGAGGIWFPGSQLTPRVGYTSAAPLVWRHEWPPHITARLVTDTNPSGCITNSDLELAGGLLHLNALVQAFDVRERTVLSQGDNLSTTFWERKGSTSTASAPAYLLRLFDRFRGDLSAAQATVLARVSPGRATSNATAWSKWIAFTTFQDKVPFLQIFAGRVHSGELAARGNPVKSRSAEDYVWHIAQTFLNMGAQDPRLDAAFHIDFRLQRTLRAWKQSDPAPLRVKPVPVTVIRHIAASATSALASPTYQAASDMIILAFFFLLRPGEYTDNDGDPFRLENVQLFIGDTRLPILAAPECELRLARFASLTFTTQKNGVRGEVIGLACSGDPYLCPVQAIIRRVLYLREHTAPPTTPLARVFNTPDKVTASYLTVQIRNAVAACGPHLGFLPTEVSARCLRAAGATALLLARVDPNVIRLIGRWRSDEMLRYLHVQAYPLMRDYAQRMLSAGSYTLIPNHLVPQR